MELVVFELPPGQFEQALKAVEKKLPDISQIPNLTIYVVPKGKEKKLPLTRLPPAVASAFRRLIMTVETSFSYSEGGKNLILIRVPPEDLFLLQNNLALRGLIVHELMHSLLRVRGLDDSIKACFGDILNETIPLLENLPYSKKASMSLFVEVGKTAIMVLKDLYSNHELIRKGFARELLEYYSRLFGLGKSCPLPSFHLIKEGRPLTEKELPYLGEIINFELQLIPAWLPFLKTNRTVAKKLKRHIYRCFEKNLGFIPGMFHEIELLYRTEFLMTCQFDQDYYRQVLNKFYALLGGVDLFSLGLSEAIEMILRQKSLDEDSKFILKNLLKSYFLHLRPRKDKKSRHSIKQLRKMMVKFMSKGEVSSTEISTKDKCEILKLPILLSLEKARHEFLEKPRSNFIDVAFFCSKAGSSVQPKSIFSLTAKKLSSLDVSSPYRLVEQLLYIELLYKREVHNISFPHSLPKKLMTSFRRYGIVPTNQTVDLALSIIQHTYHQNTNDPQALAFLYNSILKLTLKDKKLLSACMYALGIKSKSIKQVLSNFR